MARPQKVKHKGKTLTTSSQTLKEERELGMGGWEIVDKPKWKAKQGKVYVSLNRRGEIAMNGAAFAAIGEPASVALLFDAKERKIGVKFPVTADRNFFRVRRTGRGKRTRVVRALRLLRQSGFSVDRTIVFTNVQIEKFRGDPMLVLSLDEAR